MIHAFRFLDDRILLDVESGALSLVDEDTFLVASAIERGEDPLAQGLDRALTLDILAELEELRAQGAFDTPKRCAPFVPGGAVIKSLCLHVAHDCNLRCKYCFASTGDFHGARMLMDADVARRAIDFLLTHSGKRKHLEVDLFGGEPLLNFPLCKEIVAYGRAREKAFGKHISFTMTTNCVALTDESIAWINREMDNVVISIDGRREVHDALRPTVNGKGSYDIILEKAKKLIAARGGKEYYIRGTFTKNNLDFTEDVKALVSEGFTQLSLEPVVLAEDDPLAITGADLPRVREEYETLSKHYLRARKDGTWFHFFHFMIDLEHGPCLRKRLTGCGAGAEYAAVTPDGDIYPCHQFVGLPEWKLGDVFSGVLDEEKQARFAACNVETKESCARCWAKYFCSGGCAANAFLYGGSIMHPHEMSCALMRMRTECALGIHIREGQ